MPIIEHSSYKPPLGLSGGHIQTVFPTLFRKLPLLPYERERIYTEDGDFLDLDWHRPQTSRRLVILSHGLEGSSKGIYIRGMARTFSQQGWNSLAWNLRSCSGEPNHKLHSYHSGSSEDLNTVIEHAHQLNQYDTIVLIGFSLGGNITLKYLGENRSTSAPIRAAVAFSVATDLASSATKLESFQNRIYMRRFLKTLREKVRDKVIQFPNQIHDNGLQQMRTFREFDGAYTAPLNGFANADEYWRLCSCGPLLCKITAPTLLINALNDPFLPPSCYPFEAANKHSRFHLETPKSGGHMGFLEFNPDQTYWSERRALQFASEHT